MLYANLEHYTGVIFGLCYRYLGGEMISVKSAKRLYNHHRDCKHITVGKLKNIGNLHTYLQRNTEKQVLIPGPGRYVMTQMTTENGRPLSLGLIPRGRLNNLCLVDKWSCCSWRNVSFLALLVHVHLGWIRWQFEPSC